MLIVCSGRCCGRCRCGRRCRQHAGRHRRGARCDDTFSGNYAAQSLRSATAARAAGCRRSRCVRVDSAAAATAATIIVV